MSGIPEYGTGQHEDYLSRQDEQRDAAPELVHAPWSASQVACLNAYQATGVMHPFTCGNDDCPGVRGMHASLVAAEDGWHCPACGYTQDWAHAFMAEWDANAKTPDGFDSPDGRTYSAPETAGQAAYEAYVTAADSAIDEYVPPWEDLGDRAVAGWVAAAKAGHGAIAAAAPAEMTPAQFADFRAQWEAHTGAPWAAAAPAAHPAPVSVPLALLSDAEKAAAIIEAATRYDREHYRDRGERVGSWASVPADQVLRLITGALSVMEFGPQPAGGDQLGEMEERYVQAESTIDSYRAEVSRLTADNERLRSLLNEARIAEPLPDPHYPDVSGGGVPYAP